MEASRGGHVDVVNILLKYGAKANQSNVRRLMIQNDLCIISNLFELQIGMTALSLAAKCNHPDVVKVLESAMVSDERVQVCVCSNINLPEWEGVGQGFIQDF